MASAASLSAKRAEPQASPPTSLSARLGATLDTEQDAWRELASAWKLDPGQGDVCDAARRQHADCFRSTAITLASIRQLDRPGIITLHTHADDGRPSYALLIGLSDQSATLRAGSQAVTVSLASLATAWRGDFATLWQAPPGYAGKPVASDAGPLADWLRQRLASLQGTPGTSLASQVSAFQLAQGLQADGIAGPTTFMQLNRAMGVPEPRLQRELPLGLKGS